LELNELALGNIYFRIQKKRPVASFIATNGMQDFRYCKNTEYYFFPKGLFSALSTTMREFKNRLFSVGMLMR